MKRAKYVANESNTNINVFFDDLKVNLKQSLIMSGNDFYPFGLPMEDRSFASDDYRFDYQGQFSEKDDETGWNAFQLRMYDARTGRWISVDPYGQYHSPYMAMGNNPVSGVDPDGGWSPPGRIKCPGQVAFFNKVLHFIQKYDDIIIGAFSSALRNYAILNANNRFNDHQIGNYAQPDYTIKPVEVKGVPYDDGRYKYMGANTHKTFKPVTLNVNSKKIQAYYRYSNSKNQVNNVILIVSIDGEGCIRLLYIIWFYHFFNGNIDFH